MIIDGISVIRILICNNAFFLLFIYLTNLSPYPSTALTTNKSAFYPQIVFMGFI